MAPWGQQPRGARGEQEPVQKREARAGGDESWEVSLQRGEQQE